MGRGEWAWRVGVWLDDASRNGMVARKYSR